MTPETKKELLAKRDEVLKELLAKGIEYHQARFMVLSAGANAEGLLDEQPIDDEDFLSELAIITEQARRETLAEVARNDDDQIKAVRAALSRLHGGKATNDDFDLLCRSGYGYIEDNEFGPAQFIYAPGDGDPYRDQVE